MTHIDDSAANVIALLMERAGKEDAEIIVMGMSDEVRIILEAFDVLRRVPDDRIVGELDDARRLAERLLGADRRNDGGQP